MKVNVAILFISHLVTSSAVPTAITDSSHDSELGIIGGDVAPVGSAPYMVALSLIKNTTPNFHCGGSLISTRSVLTAAHCIVGQTLSTILGRVGSNKWNSGGQIYTFARSVPHEAYDSLKLRNDIGLLITNTEVVMSNLVKPVKLSFNIIPSGTSVKVSGWGAIQNSLFQGDTVLDKSIDSNPYRIQPVDLMELKTFIMDDKKCVEKFKVKGKTVYPDVQMCAYKSPNTGICFGDSGSALMMLDGSGSSAQIGIASFVIVAGKCAENDPDAYTRIAAYQEWIKKHVE